MRALLVVGLLSLALAAPMTSVATGANHVVHMRFQAPGLYLFESDETHGGVLAVHVGDTVEFRSDDANHQVLNGLDGLTYGKEPTPPGDEVRLGAFNTGNVEHATSATVTIEEAGAYPYYCIVGLHRFLGMRGLIVAQ